VEGEQRNVSAERRTGGDRRRAITVVSVDDEPIIRAMLTQMLTGNGLKLIGEADNGQDAVDLVLDLRPDVVIMDLGLPGITGVQATEQISLLAPASRVLILTGSEQNSVVEAIVAGASGYVLKTAPTEEIVAAVIATANGKAVLSPQIAGKLLERIRELDIQTTDKTFANAAAIPHGADRQRTGDLHPPGQRRQQPADRRGTRAEHQHRRQPHHQHPRQAPPREPHPGRRPSSPRRHRLISDRRP
jgi:DNA-binding NarL/FixJ family response regulator